MAEATSSANEVAKVEADGQVGEHEVMMMSVEEALRSSSIQPRGSEALAAVTLASDKALVGALDSACNRTCAGEDWVQGYLKELDKAPKEIRDLVATVAEQENFKFGNGGTLPSSTRYRLPAVVAGQLVGIWVSCVPVSSLGLLLGRDLLDGLGGVLDFGQKTLLCKLFAGRPPVPLERLSAGHLALTLIPEIWPAVTRGRWRKIGPGGVLECSITCSDWAAQLLRLPRAAPSDEEAHNHNMTEASLEIGRLAFHAVFLASARDEEMCRATSPEQPDSASPGAFEHGFASPDGGSDPGCSRPLCGRSRLSCRRALEKNAVESLGPLRLEPRRSQTLVRQASRAALVAVSLSLCVFGGAMAAAGAEHGAKWMLPTPVGGPGHLLPSPPVFDDVVQEPRGAEVCLCGGTSRRSGSSCEGGRPAEGGEVLAGSPRWPPDLEGRLDKARGAASRRGLRQGHHQDAQGPHEADRRCPLCPDAGELYRHLCRALRLDGEHDAPAGPAAFEDHLVRTYVSGAAAFDDDLVRDYVTWCQGRAEPAQPSLRDVNFECFHAECGEPAGQPDAGGGSAIPGAWPAARGYVEPGASPHHEHAVGGRNPADRARRGDEGQRRLGADFRPDPRSARAAGPSAGAAGMSGNRPGPVKAGQRLMMEQAWERHRRDQLLISCSPAQLREAMTLENHHRYRKALRESFVAEIPLLCADGLGVNTSVGRAARARRAHYWQGPHLGCGLGF